MGLRWSAKSVGVHANGRPTADTPESLGTIVVVFLGNAEASAAFARVLRSALSVNGARISSDNP
jgi:hypothetical protein